MQTNSKTERLRDLYTHHWCGLVQALEPFSPAEKGLSNPLLIDLFPEYEQSQVKVLIIGQQTNGWGTFARNLGENPVDELMNWYRKFHLGQWYRPTSFWQACYVLNMNLNPRGPSFGFAWTNLVKLDQETKRPSPEVEGLVRQHFPVLVEEIEIASPDFVIFFTGPRYDDAIREHFPDSRLTPLLADGRELARVDNQNLPGVWLRTYHPGYLARDADLYKNVMKEIVRTLGSSREMRGPQ